MEEIYPLYPIPTYKDGGIHIKKKNKGKFNALKKRTGKSTEELTHSKNPLTPIQIFLCNKVRRKRNESCDDWKNHRTCRNKNDAALYASV